MDKGRFSEKDWEGYATNSGATAASRPQATASATAIPSAPALVPAG
jgi:hypothetical protein